MAVPVSPSSSSSSENKKERKKKRSSSSSSILGTLRSAIERVQFLLSFSATRWMMLSSVTAPRRKLSFDPRSPPSLLDVEGGLLLAPSSSSSSSGRTSTTTSRSTSMGTATTRSVSRTSSSSTASPEILTRTMSGVGSVSASPGNGDDDDIDRRADEFIANFHRQLQMERQVSLQLRYVRGNSWDNTTP